MRRWLSDELGGPVARGTLTSLSLRILSILIGFILAIVTARVLEAEGYGAAAFAISVAMLSATIAGLGLEPLAVREVPRIISAQDGPGLRRFTTRVLLVGIVAALAASGVVAAWVRNWYRGTEAFVEALEFVPLLIPLLVGLFLLRGLARGMGRVALAQAPFEVVRPLVLLSALVVVVLVGVDVGPGTYVVLAVVAATIALILAAPLVARALRGYLGSSADLPDQQNLVASAAALYAVTLLGFLMNEANTLLLGWLSNPTETGLFQPVVRVTPLILIGSQAVAMRYAPRVSELWSAGEHVRLAHITKRATVVTFGSAVVLSIALLAVAPWLLSLFGREFVSSESALWWVAGAQIISASCGLFNVFLTMTGSPWRMVIPQIAGLAVNVTLGVVLIPSGGALAAAQAMAAGIVVWAIVGLLVTRRSVGVDPSVIGVLRHSEDSGSSDE